MQKERIDLIQDNVVSFKYNGRNIIGRITYVGEKSIIICLYCDYKGKNMEWCKGECKECYISLIKKLSVIS